MKHRCVDCIYYDPHVKACIFWSLFYDSVIKTYSNYTCDEWRERKED